MKERRSILSKVISTHLGTWLFWCVLGSFLSNHIRPSPSRQVLSGKYPWSEVRADAAVMLRLSQGLKPGRPLARPIDDRHWAFIERCWSSIPDRPLVEDLVSSLQQFLGGYPSSPRIRELFAVPSPSSDLPNLSCRDELGDDVTSMASQQGIAHKFDQNVRIQCPVSHDAYNHAERQFGGRPRAGSESIVLTPNKHATEASIGDASSRRYRLIP